MRPPHLCSSASALLGLLRAQQPGDLQAACRRELSSKFAVAPLRVARGVAAQAPQQWPVLLFEFGLVDCVWCVGGAAGHCSWLLHESVPCNKSTFELIINLPRLLPERHLEPLTDDLAQNACLNHQPA